jgi:polyisoprenyl-teichoic acid--peptidoglycan teichoic acid transferase
MGGIELKITQEEAARISGINQAGMFTLTGEQALTFSRIRKIDSDLERARRQRDVMEAAIRKMFNQSVSSYPELLKKTFPLVKTNMTSHEILTTGMSIVSNNIRTIEQSRYPDGKVARGQLINGVYYYVFDRAGTIHQIGKYLYLDQK